MLRLLVILVVTSLTLAAPHKRLLEQRSSTSIYKVTDERGPWNVGKDNCEAMGCILAEPKSEQEQTAIMAVLPPSGYFWIGVTKFGHEDRFTYYTDDQDLVYSNWKPGQPQYEHGNDCVEIVQINYSRWSTFSCGYYDQAVCECEYSD
ncbi:mannose-binding protein-like [Saccoglossus kowalevskii]